MLSWAPSAPPSTGGSPDALPGVALLSASLGEEDLHCEDREDAGKGVIQAAHHTAVSLQPGRQAVGGENDEHVHRHADHDEEEAEKEQFVRDGGVAGGDELRQEGHEEDDDLRVQQIDPEAVGDVGEWRSADRIDLLDRQAGAEADRLDRQPEQIGSAARLQDGKGNRRGRDQRGNAEGHQAGVNDNAERGAKHDEKCCLFALRQRAADRQCHVGARRHRQQQARCRKGKKSRQARYEVHENAPKAGRGLAFSIRLSVDCKSILLFEECLELIGVIGVPARQRRAVLDDVAGRPEHAAFVDWARHVIIWAENVEIAALQAFHHEIDRLLRRPGAGGFFLALAFGQAGEDEAGNEEMGRYFRTFRIAQLMLQRFGKHFYAGLRDIVGGIAGRCGDALLRAGIDDDARFAMRNHAGSESARAVDDAKQVDAEDRVPSRLGAEDRGFRADAGIVHQHVYAAEALQDGALQRFQRLLAADIGLDGHDILFASDRLEIGGRLRQPVAAEVGNDDAHAERGEIFRSGKADAGCAAGDDGNIGFLENVLNIGHERRPPQALFGRRRIWYFREASQTAGGRANDKTCVRRNRRADGCVHRRADQPRQLRFAQRGH
ncbi:hypothetical protein RHSP_37268 [Rhizobium freirei PRF 81]|uniref:Uncharacterized protein n=1 Tax=Rhizobium freirei PRF 81 TaxID=363754 RepID=N6UHC1_9HYPH|nr:hypothetical protein RHSP_37268 [Rhizobium freirei PRF 81]